MHSSARKTLHASQVVTYTNEDIETFARAWTGFSLQAGRANLEYLGVVAGGGQWMRNLIDPMLLRPDWRDPFPKLDLHGGNLAG